LPRIPLGRATAISELILQQLRTTPGVNWAEPVGSLRRGHDLIDDLALLASTDDPSDLLDALESFEGVQGVRQRGADIAHIAVERVQVAIRCAAPSHAGSALLQLTGSAAHVERLSALAEERRLRLDANGLQRDHELIAATEEEIYAALGLAFVPPELRAGDEEIELAIAGRLPALVTRADIRGDLHMHSHWSDGRDSIEDMVAQSVALGYEYVAITDHSTNSAASRNLSLDDVERQHREITALREQYPQIVILHGAEVDILADGRLDFPDEVLRRFDIVLASLHDRAGQSPRALLQRYERAMHHPLVSLVTHPMNRPGPERSGYDLDVDRLFELAATTGTALEIDGAPSHLDLESSLARRAVQAGVMLSIDSDAHRTEMLSRHMSLGLLTARRGWVEPQHVLNVRPYADLMEFLSRKRSGTAQ
jgi:DNA polymerase (family X)